jgi:hypothetical protein
MPSNPFRLKGVMGVSIPNKMLPVISNIIQCHKVRILEYQAQLFKILYSIQAGTRYEETSSLENSIKGVSTGEKRMIQRSGQDSSLFDSFTTKANPDHGITEPETKKRTQKKNYHHGIQCPTRQRGLCNRNNVKSTGHDGVPHPNHAICPTAGASFIPDLEYPSESPSHIPLLASQAPCPRHCDTPELRSEDQQ